MEIEYIIIILILIGIILSGFNLWYSMVVTDELRRHNDQLWKFIKESKEKQDELFNGYNELIKDIIHYYEKDKES